MFQCFVWKWADVMSKGGTRPPAKALGYYSLERTAPLSQCRGSEREGRYSLMHKCLLLALNGGSPWWISPADALSMKPALCIRASTQTQKGSITSSVVRCISELKHFNASRWVQASRKFIGRILGDIFFIFHIEKSLGTKSGLWYFWHRCFYDSSCFHTK